MAAPPMAVADKMRMLQKELRLCEKEMDSLLQTREMLMLSRERVKVVFGNVINSLGRLRDACEEDFRNAVGGATRRIALTEEIATLDEQMEFICLKAINFIDHVLRFSTTAEDRVFYLILVGDLYKRHFPLRQCQCHFYYRIATELAGASLRGSNPIRLKLALKFAKRYPPRFALVICDEALEAATSDTEPDTRPLSMYYVGRIQHHIRAWNAHG